MCICVSMNAFEYVLHMSINNVERYICKTIVGYSVVKHDVQETSGSIFISI